MIEYCLLVYLTCSNAKCIVKIPTPSERIASTNGRSEFFYDSNVNGLPSISANSMPYKSKGACVSAGNQYKSIKNLGGVRYGITCYAINFKENYDCFGYEIHNPTPEPRHE